MISLNKYVQIVTLLFLALMKEENQMGDKYDNAANENHNEWYKEGVNTNKERADECVFTNRFHSSLVITLELNHMFRME